MHAFLRSLLAAVALAVVLAPPASAQSDPTCDVTWNATNGDWGDGGRWSGGAVPSTAQHACLPAGDYTVTIGQARAPKGTTIGAGVTVHIAASQYLYTYATGSLVNHGTIELESGASIYGPVTNDGLIQDAGTIASRPWIHGAVANTGTIRANTDLGFQPGANTIDTTGGTLATAGAASQLYVSGGSTSTYTLAGTVTNPGNVIFQYGTLNVRALSATGNAPRFIGDGNSTLDLTGATGGVEVNNVVVLGTDIPAGATVTVRGRDSWEGALQIRADRVNDGTLILDGLNNNLGSDLRVDSGVRRLTNNGTLRMTGTTNTTRDIFAEVANTASGTIAVDAGVQTFLRGDFNTARTWSSAGTVTVAGLLSLESGLSTFRQTGGTITVTGTFRAVYSTFAHAGGTITGVIDIANQATLDPSGPGAAAYRVTGATTLAGDVSADATVTAESTNAGAAAISLGADRSVAGTLHLTSTSGSNDARIDSPNGSRLTVSGTLHASGGTGGPRNIRVPLTLTASSTWTVDDFASVTIQANAATFEHVLAGTVTVAGGASVNFSYQTQTIRQRPGSTISGLGTFMVSGASFVHEGGTIVGTVRVTSAQLYGELDPSGPGSAHYSTTGNVVLTGDIPEEATVDVGAAGADGTLYVRGDRTNDGELAVGPIANTAPGRLVDDTGGGTLTNAGALTINSGADNRELRVAIVNTGTLTVNAHTTAIAAREVPAVTNSGTVTLHANLYPWRGYVQTGGLTDIVGGAALSIPRNPSVIDIQGGRLRGSGTLQGQLRNAGIVEIGRPGTPYGTLALADVIDQVVRVDASYLQTASGRLLVDVGGTGPGTSHDNLTVTGALTLAGTLDIATASGYTPDPAVPDTYNVLISESRSGQFDDLVGDRFYSPDYRSNGFRLVARVPPPPQTEVGIADAHVVEGEGALELEATLDKPSEDTITVEWTTEDDSAREPGDYTESSGTLTFPPGETTRTLTVPVVDDTDVEGVEELLVRLRHPTNARLGVATATGRIDPDDVGVTKVSPGVVGSAGPATVTITGGGLAPGTTAKLTRSGEVDRVGTVVSGPTRQSVLGVRFDMEGAAAGAWTLEVRTPSGATVTRPITVTTGPPALDAVVSVPSALRFGWYARVVVSLHNRGFNDVGIDGVRLTGSSLQVRPYGGGAFADNVLVDGEDLGDAQVIPPQTTRLVEFEAVSTTTVAHALMNVRAEVFPAGYLSQAIGGSDPDPGIGAISGHVRTSSGAPVRGLLVTAAASGRSASATTDGSGAYRISPLKPGTYTVSAGGAKDSVAVNENARTLNLVSAAADISGSVGTSDATVALLRDGKAVSTVDADASGGFRFRVLKPGSYRLVADSPTGGRVSQALTVAAGVDQAGLRPAFGTRTLTVDATAGAIVRLWPDGEDALPSQATANGSGVASFTGLGAGALTVEARADGKAPARVTVAAGATEATVTPPTGATLTGTVTAGGAPVAATLVIATDGNGEQHAALTGADGHYSIGGLPAGGADVWFVAPGYTPLVSRGVSGTADAAVTDGGASLEVTAPVGRVVRVVDPATGVSVAAAVAAGPDGRATLDRLPTGTFTVTADGASSATVALGGGPGARAKRAAAGDAVTLDDDGYPVAADPESDPALELYTSPFTGLIAPQQNAKDAEGWDQVLPDYEVPCPTADRLYDLLSLKRKAKLTAFQAWVAAWIAAEDMADANINLYVAKTSQLAANIVAAAALMRGLPKFSGTLGNVLQAGANWLGTASELGQGVGEVDLTTIGNGANDLIQTILAAQAEATESKALNRAGNVLQVLGLLKSLSDLTKEMQNIGKDARDRANAYMQAQDNYNRLLLEINDLLKQYRAAVEKCPNWDDPDPKPPAPIAPSGTIENIMANDPNEIHGPAGVGEEGWIPRSQTLDYSIRFENLGPGSVIPEGQEPASAPATIVTVVTTVSPSVDIDEVTLGGVGWGDVELTVPPGRTSYHADVPQDDGDIVRVDGSLDRATRKITWTLKTIDPATGEVDGSPTAGFLPPEDGSGNGQGHVDYLAGSASDVAQGAEIEAEATITFDVNDPIDTNTHVNTVDGTAPTSTLDVGTAGCDGRLPVSWDGSDTGSGVASYDVEASSNGGLTWTPWLAGTTAKSGTFSGAPGRSYAFRVAARDAVGNAEATHDDADASADIAACDLEAPRTTATVPAGAVSGWHGGAVDVALDAVDAPGGSGVASLRWAAGGSPVTVAAAATTARVSREGETELTFAATDARGNAEADAHLTVRVDTTAPTITATDGAEYAVGQSVRPDVTCEDAGVGVATCEFPAALDTAAPGPHTFTARAVDKLGHEATITRSYTVAAPAPEATPTPTPAPTTTGGGGGGGGTTPTAVTFRRAPVKAKIGKASASAVVVTLTSAEKFAFTGRATLVTRAKKPKAQSRAASFSLAAGKARKVTLKLNAAGKRALRRGRTVRLALKLELRSGGTRKTVTVNVSVRRA